MDIGCEIKLSYDPEDGCYWARTPDYHNCNAFGDTPQEALQELAVVLKMVSTLQTPTVAQVLVKNGEVNGHS